MLRVQLGFGWPTGWQKSLQRSCSIGEDMKLDLFNTPEAKPRLLSLHNPVKHFWEHMYLI